MKIQDIADELIIIPKQVFDILLNSKNAGDLLALYSFYYYTAKWQKTYQPKCTNTYCMKGLDWGETRFMKAKKQLVALGLIQTIKLGDSKTNGWYIKLLYTNEINQEPGNQGPCPNQEPGNQGPWGTKNPENRGQMLNNIINTFSINNKKINKKRFSESPTMQRKTKPKSSIYEEIDFPCEEEYKPIIQEWFDYKKEKKSPYTAKGRKAFYKRLVSLSGDNTVTANEIIQQSISNNYQGIFPLNSSSNPKPTNTGGTRSSSNKKIDYSKIKVKRKSEL